MAWQNTPEPVKNHNQNHLQNISEKRVYRSEKRSQPSGVGSAICYADEELLAWYTPQVLKKAE